jgi:integrase
VALLWEDVDWPNEKLRVRHTRLLRNLEPGEQIGTPKTRSSRRDLDLDEGMLAVLRDQRKRLLQQGQGAVVNANGPVFPSSRTGRHTYSTTIRDHLFKILDKMGMGGQINTHGLRHTFTSILISEGVPIPMVSAMLGHSNSDMVNRIYSHPVGDQKAVVAKMSSVIFGLPKTRDTQDSQKLESECLQGFVAASVFVNQ